MLLLVFLVIHQGLQLKGSPSKTSNNLMYYMLDNSGMDVSKHCHEKCIGDRIYSYLKIAG